LKKSIAIIGGGASALSLAATLDQRKYTVTIYEKNKALGRKFLVAGDGGFNLTHSEGMEGIINRYTPNNFLKESLIAFTNQDFRNWLNEIGINTFVGTSKRVYPIKSIKPIQVLNAILTLLKNQGVVIKTNHHWLGWDNNNQLLFQNESSVKADIVVFALGGASWNVTGSDGAWLNLFADKGIKTIPFQASNCAYKINWDTTFIQQFEGSPLKNISITCNKAIKKGEIVFRKDGIEGGAVYALSPQIRKQLNEKESAIINIDLKPSLPSSSILDGLTQKGKKTFTDILKTKFNFTELHISLLKSILSKEEFNDATILSRKIKNLPIVINDFGAIDEAISTVGGIALSEVNKNFELHKLPHHFVIGEMLDWEAPTGGYLLQACFSMGYYVGKLANNRQINS
jgi:uncharacterized flavoprotein (TIGR03862 family)